MFVRQLLAIVTLSLASLTATTQFAHTQGKQIVDGSGKPLLLRGTSLGNWAFWPYNKLEKNSAVVTVTPPERWDKIVASAKQPRGMADVEARLKVRPDQQTVNRPFDGLLQNIKLEHCRINQGYLSSLGLKQVSTDNR